MWCLPYKVLLGDTTPRHINVQYIVQCHALSWQAQHLVWCCASIFVAGATCGQNLRESRSTKCCIFQKKCASKAREVTSANRRVRDDQRVHARIMLGSFSTRPPLYKCHASVSAVFSKIFSYFGMWGFIKNPVLSITSSGERGF